MTQKLVTLPRLLSLSELARRLNISHPTASELVRLEKWLPDATQGRTLLFDIERLADLAAAAGKTLENLK